MTIVPFDLMTAVKPIAAAIQELLKFTVINIIDTKNRTLDNLINTLFLALLTFVGAYFTSWSFQRYWYIGSFNAHKSTFIQQKELFDRYVHEGLFKYATWNMTVFRRFENQFVTFIDRNHRGTTVETPMFLNPYTGLATGLCYVDKITSWVPYGGVRLIKMRDKDMVFLHHQLDTHNIIICYTNKNLLDELLKEIGGESTTNESIFDEEKIAPCRIYEAVENMWNTNPIYDDRTFDTFVSRYKPAILKLIDRFQAANNGTDTSMIKQWNMGFMLYGRPGTGKTLLMKCLANYLDRHLINVDMRTIKNKKHFSQTFTQLPSTCTRKNYIFCFDEFDCVQGVIRKRDNSVVNDDNEIDKLRARHLALLQMLNGSSEHKSILSEIEAVKKEIINLENGLTLDSILTVLDGTIEVRGRVIIACTNHIDLIDPALIRPGRFDLCINLDAYTSEEIVEYLTVLYKPTELERTNLSQRCFPEGRWTPAEILNIACQCDTLGECVKRLMDGDVIVAVDEKYVAQKVNSCVKPSISIEECIAAELDIQRNKLDAQQTANPKRRRNRRNKAKLLPK